MNKAKFVLLAAGVSLALAFTFSCSSDDGGGDTFATCSGKMYDITYYECVRGEIVGSCKGESYYPEYQSCENGKIIDGAEISSSSSSVPQGGISYGILSYEGQKYKTVRIGDQVWMAENLNYNVSGSVCYDNEPSNCATYGRLYNWATAMELDPSCNDNSCSGQVQSKHRGICPSGWHIPGDYDRAQLFDYVGGNSVAGKHLKAKTGWSYCGPSDSGSYYSCEDTYGFSALPGGYYGYSLGKFYYVGEIGLWWSADEWGYSWSNAYFIDCDFEKANWSSDDKSNLFSVRCVQD